MAAIEIRMNRAALDRRLRELEGGRKELRRLIRSRMRELGQLVRGRWRAEFGPRYLTDPKTRRRYDKTPVLGVFSGASRRSLRVTTRFPRGDTGRQLWRTTISPGKRGAYLHLHEAGTRYHQARPLASYVERVMDPTVQRELGRILYEILPGW